MTTIEDEESYLNYLEQIDNKFCKIKNLLREIKRKVKVEADKNKKINLNCKHWVNFFKLGTDEVTETNETIKAEPDLINLSTTDNIKISFTESENIQNNPVTEESVHESSFKQNLSDTSLAVFDIDNVPKTLSNEPVLVEIYEYVRKNGLVDLQNIKTHFEDVSAKKIDIIVDFLVGRNYIMKKSTKLMYKQ